MKTYKLSDEEKAIENEVADLKPISGEKKADIDKIISQVRKQYKVRVKREDT